MKKKDYFEVQMTSFGREWDLQSTFGADDFKRKFGLHRWIQHFETIKINISYTGFGDSEKSAVWGTKIETDGAVRSCQFEASVSEKSWPEDWSELGHVGPTLGQLSKPNRAN